MLRLLRQLFGTDTTVQPAAPQTQPVEGEPPAPSHGDIVRRAARLHHEGIQRLAAARNELTAIYPYAKASEDFVLQQQAMGEEIEAVLERYRADEKTYKYFHGYPYQGLGIAAVFGDRVCDYRFDSYELRNFIRSTDTVLDIGCNCGFMAILASYRIGCAAHGVDINPYMIELGRIVARGLRIDQLVSLHAHDLKTFTLDCQVDVVLSFATHWTDDENYRVSIGEHMQRMARYLRPEGTLIFETHCNDVGDNEFYAAMAEARKLFSFDSFHKMTDSDTRELYIMKKR